MLSRVCPEPGSAPVTAGDAEQPRHRRTYSRSRRVRFRPIYGNHEEAPATARRGHWILSRPHRRGLFPTPADPRSESTVRSFVRTIDGRAAARRDGPPFAHSGPEHHRGRAHAGTSSCPDSAAWRPRRHRERGTPAPGAFPGAARRMRPSRPPHRTGRNGRSPRIAASPDGARAGTGRTVRCGRTARRARRGWVRRAAWSRADGPVPPHPRGRRSLSPRRTRGPPARSVRAGWGSRRTVGTRHRHGTRPPRERAAARPDRSWSPAPPDLGPQVDGVTPQGNGPWS
jgi:hypothetical protein